MGLQIRQKLASLGALFDLDAFCRARSQGRWFHACLRLFCGDGDMNAYPTGRMGTDARIQRIAGATNGTMKEMISRIL